MQVFEQFRRALRRGRQIADDQHGPLVAHQLERSSYRTSIYLTSSQFFAFNNSSPRVKYPRSLDRNQFTETASYASPSPFGSQESVGKSRRDAMFIEKVSTTNPA